MRSLRRLVSPAALTLVCASSLAGQERHALPGDRVSIYNLAGRLRVEPGAGPEVVAQITRGGRDAAKLRVAEGELRGFNALRVVYPSDRIVYPEMNSRGRTQLRVNADGTFGGGDDGWSSRDRVEIRGSGDGLEAYADIVVSVPKGRTVVLHWGVGEAAVRNVDGDIRVSVAAAHVTSDHTRGRLTLDTGSGPVEVHDAQGEIVLDTGSGGVTVDGVRGESLVVDAGSGAIAGGNVDVKTLKMDVGSGGVRLERVTAPRVAIDAGSGGIDLSFLAPVDQLTADAGSGGVTVRLPASQTGEVDLEAGSGGIDTDFPVTMTRVQRNHVRGTVGTGSARIRIETGSGSLRLLKM